MEARAARAVEAPSARARSRSLSRSASRGPQQIGAARDRFPSPHQVPGFHVTLALDGDCAARLALELVAEEFMGRLRDLDAARRTLGLHPARDVHRVAPEVVQEPLPADDASDDRARVHPDSELEAEVPDGPAGRHRRGHVKGEAREDRGMVRARVGNAGRDHVGVADRLDLLEAVTLGQGVENG